MIVFADANGDKAVDGAVVGMRCTRQGQSCTAASRIFVHEKVYDDFVAKLRAKVDAMVMGDPLDEKTDIGTIISPEPFAKVQGYIEHRSEERRVGKEGGSKCRPRWSSDRLKKKS